MKAVLQVLFFDLIAKVLLGAATILLIRYTPEQEYATYTFALSLSTLLSQTVSSTFNRIYIIGYDQFHARQKSSAFLWLQMWSLGAVSVVLLPLAPPLGMVFVFAAALAAANCLSEYCKTALQQEKRFLRYSMTELGRAVAVAASVFALVAIYDHNLSADGILLSQAMAVGVLFIILFRGRIVMAGAVRIRSVGRLATNIAAGEYKWLLGYFLALALFGQVDVLMLRVLADDAALASYGAAFRYYSLLSLALAAVHAVLLPVIRQLKSTEEIRRILVQHRRLTFAFIPAVFLVGWTAQWLLPWIDLGKYPQSVDVFRVLCASAVISFAFSPHVNMIMRYERFAFLFRLILGALAVSVIFNWMLIPQAGAMGAAWATLIASACVTVPIYLLSRRLIAASEPAH